MTDLQAAIGLVELERYDSETLPRRQAICERYTAAFAGDDRFIVPTLTDAGPSTNDQRSSNIEPRTTSYHLYMLRVAKATEAQRDTIISVIAQRGVSVNVHFIPLPLLSFYKAQGNRMEDFPNAYRHYSREISLPVYYDLTDAQVDEVVRAVKEAVNEVMVA
jgi:dTDP-4-amino-4,6-dideoxygalactose transaminase